MHVQHLTTPWQRSRGAMFRKRLGETVLLFAYPQTAPRIFHTFCCPPLRILALDDAGEILFDQVRQPSQFVRLPASRLIVEADPNLPLSPARLRALVKGMAGIRSAART